MEERWKSIPGYEGLYEASDMGRIRTAEGKTTSNARYPVRVWKQRILKYNYNKRDKSDKKDAMIDLWKDGKRHHLNVARVVAMTWCDGYRSDLTVNHKDGDTLNNCSDNLEWVSQRENNLHALNTGLIPTRKPCSLVNSKGETIHFPSMTEASLFLGRNYLYISNCKRKGTTAKSISGEQYDFA